MMQLYIFEREKKGDLYRNDTDSLLQKCASLYLKETSPDSGSDTFREVLRTQKGKPYFRDSEIEFSVSHSRELWVCLMGHSCCGVDIEFIKRTENAERIVDRFFCEGEKDRFKDALLEDRERRFFDIWTAKEAYAKLKGVGISSGMLDLDSAAAEDEGTVFFRQIDVLKGYVCTVCAEEEGELDSITVNDITKSY